ncbi:hypothetical protein SEA_CECE_79 [Microbacterium phage Cece]|nr:hypothetical protein SEA_CECE_79 [Microbacterium phage Cece]
MVDVLHFQFEDYFTFYGEEHAGSVNGIRKSLWKTFYDIDFKYEVKTGSDRRSPTRNYANDISDPLADLDSVDPFSPRDKSTEELKPYIPPTNFDPDAANPFPGLDGPLN